MLPQYELLTAHAQSAFPEIPDELFWKLYASSSPYSLLGQAKFFNLYQFVKYIARNGIVGDFVECGCLFGGASIFTHLAMRANGIRRKLYLFDTFEGIPGEECDLITGGKGRGHQITNYYNGVKENIVESGGDTDDFVLTAGKVEDTLPGTKLGEIAILRLDTDFYTSTRCELETLCPKLSAGGVIIIDDYGQWVGAREATDEYFSKVEHPPLLNRIDPGVWAGVKYGP